MNDFTVLYDLSLPTYHDFIKKNDVLKTMSEILLDNHSSCSWCIMHCCNL